MGKRDEMRENNEKRISDLWSKAFQVTIYRNNQRKTRSMSSSNYNNLPQKHYLGVLARAAWFAYLDPSQTDLLYFNWQKSRTSWRASDDLWEKGQAFDDFMSVLSKRPIYIHSSKHDTDCFLIETIDNEIWVVWRGTQATMEDGFSLRDLYADVRFRLTQCKFLPGQKLRVHAGFLSKYETMRKRILSEVRSRIPKMKKFTKKVTVRCIGHSLGGALAMLNAADMAHDSGVNEWFTDAQIACCTFGAPAAGNKAFVDYFNAAVFESTRVCCEDDPITYLPPFPWFSHVNGKTMVKECNSNSHLIISMGIKGILNHHCAVYIHGSDVLDGKRLPLPIDKTFKIIFEGLLKTILIYAIVLILLHMDRYIIGLYCFYILTDILDNHFLSVKKYLLPETNKENIIIQDE